jgi:hypothetical protein
MLSIRINFGQLDPDLDPNSDPLGQKDPRKYKKEKKFFVSKCWMFSFEGSPVSWTSFMEAQGQIIAIFLYKKIGVFQQ